MEGTDNAVVNQPQQTTEATSTPEPFAWLNDQPETEQPATDNPEPNAGDDVEGEELEAGSEEADESTSEDQSEEPTVEEWLEALTPNERARYAKRYPTAWKALNDPNQPDDMKQLLRDKVNSDSEISKLRSARTEEAEPTGDEAEEPEVQEAVSSSDPVKERERYYKEVDAIVAEVFDPKVSDELGLNLLKGFGVDVASTDPEVQALVKNAPEVGRTLSRGLVDGIATALPALLFRTDAEGVPYLSRLIDQAFPGTLQNFEQRTYSSAWDQVRNSDPAFKELPAYGPSDSAFGKWASEAAAMIPNFDSIRFPGTKQEQAAAMYTLMAKVASGSKPSPAVVANAISTGKKIAAKRESAVRAGKVMGAGQSTNKIDSSGKDNSFKSMIEEYNANQRSTPLKG